MVRTFPRFGLGVPTATEGMMYPVPYATVEQAVELAVTAERLGFDSVWGNDHVSTQAYVRAEFDDPPSFYDPLTYLAFVAASTTTLRLATGVLVLPFRHPVLAAKQIATLDQLSGGRVLLGVGVGAYREEYESMFPGRPMHRGRQVDEFLEALRRLHTLRRAGYSGEYISFNDIESWPKPVQNPLPILVGGNSSESLRRAATLANGWLPACLTPAEYAAGLHRIGELRDAANLTLVAPFEATMQMVVAIGDTHEAAVEKFRASQVYRHLNSLAESTMSGRLDDSLEARNLVGTVDEVREQVRVYREAGVETFAALLFAAHTVEETIDDMARFSEDIIAPTTRGAP